MNSKTSHTLVSNSKKASISLAPIPYFWSAKQVHAYYERMAESKVDVFYLGEVICSKRKALRLNDWLDIARMLKNQGKEVVLSTLSLVEAASELSVLNKICGNGEFMVEAGDLSAVHMLSQLGVDFVLGSTVNIYNHDSWRKMKQLGMKRWVLPIEHSEQDIESFGNIMGCQTELMVWGRLPLAYSARCYTARTHNLAKDDCGFVCDQYPDGLKLATQENDEFLVINGIQTQSAKQYNLLENMPHPAIDIYRVTPQISHSEAVVALLRKRLDGELSSAQVHESVIKLFPEYAMSNGYWFKQPGMSQHTTVLQ